MSTVIMSDEQKAGGPETITLHLAQVGDRELWVLHDSEGLWSIPMFLEWRVNEADKADEYALVWPAMAPYPLQLLSIRGALEAHSVINSKERWLLRRDVVQRALKKAQGITPRYYYRWPDRRFQPIPATSPVHFDLDVSNKLASNDWEAFLKHISHRYSLPITMLRVFWRAITSEAPAWMLETRQAFDLGFCRLVALPYRPNWKEIVCQKMKHFHLLGMFNLPQEKRRPALESAGLPEVLCSPENICVPPVRNGGTFPRMHYCLEAIPTKRFERAVNVAEGSRLAAGQSAYVASYEATIEKQYENILAALEAYLHKVFLPFARVCEVGYSGLPRFVATRGIKAVKVHPNRPPAFIIPPGKAFSTAGGEGVRPAVREKATALQAVPVVPRGTDDVRESDGIGSDRVSVPHAGQGGPAGISVLPIGETDGSSSRMDGGTES